jgi:hypothetical protein
VTTNEHVFECAQVFDVRVTELSISSQRDTRGDWWWHALVLRARRRCEHRRRRLEENSRKHHYELLHEHNQCDAPDRQNKRFQIKNWDCAVMERFLLACPNAQQEPINVINSSGELRNAALPAEFGGPVWELTSKDMDRVTTYRPAFYNTVSSAVALPTLQRRM